MFQVKNNGAHVKTRKAEYFHVTQARTNRLANSAILYMQRLLNANRK